MNSAIPCDPKEVEEPERCLLGKLNIPGAFQLLTGEKLTTVQSYSTSHPEINLSEHSITAARTAHPEIKFRANNESQINSTTTTIKSPLQQTFSISQGLQPMAEGITSSAASNLVYVLGTIGYDFGTEARRDSFKQLMPGVEIDGVMIPANPDDSRQIVDYLEQNPSEGKSLIWTLNQELNPIYAIEPVGGFSADVYETLQLILAGQIEPKDSEDYIERVSIPAKLTNITVELFSGQIVPIITLINTRGIYGWQVNGLVDAALQTVSPQKQQLTKLG